MKAHWTISKREAGSGGQAPAPDVDAAATATELGVLRALAAGMDPLTGEVLPDDSLLQNPQVIRALFCAVRALEHPQQPAVKSALDGQEQRAGKVLPQNAGKSWSAEENCFLCERFDAGTPIKDIAQMHGRTRGSIKSRLIKMGRLQHTDADDDAQETGQQA